MRTKNSFKNVVSIVILNLIIGLLGFLKVKVFINALSNDIYSLNQLFYQIFGYLVIADLGFGLILNKRLYESFAKNDKAEINNIYSTSKKFYQIIGFLIILISLVISFIVHFFTKANLSNAYIQIIFIIFIFRNVLDYFFVSPRLVMEADQKNYKINHLVKGIKILETIAEIILALLGFNYLYILFPGIIITIVMDLYINKKVYKEYPWLKDNHTFSKKYLKGTKDLIYLKLSGIMNSNTDIILISTFINPLCVIVYTSYSYITKFITDTLYIVASAITPSYANVLCKENNIKSYQIFSELNIMFLYLSSFISIMLYIFLNKLIILWIGEDYLVNKITLLLFVIITFTNIASKAISITINSKGLFKETKIATILETVLNFILSLVLIHKYGLIGVLLGTIISYFLTSFIQNGYYIFKYIFKEKVTTYFLNYLIVCIITGIVIYIGSFLSFNINNVSSFVLYVLLSAIVVFVILSIIFYLIFKSFRNLVKRCYEIILRRKK